MPREKFNKEVVSAVDNLMRVCAEEKYPVPDFSFEHKFQRRRFTSALGVGDVGAYVTALGEIKIKDDKEAVSTSHKKTDTSLHNSLL